MLQCCCAGAEGRKVAGCTATTTSESRWKSGRVCVEVEGGEFRLLDIKHKEWPKLERLLRKEKVSNAESGRIDV